MVSLNPLTLSYFLFINISYKGKMKNKFETNLKTLKSMNVCMIVGNILYLRKEYI